MFGRTRKLVPVTEIVIVCAGGQVVSIVSTVRVNEASAERNIDH